jgi:hypothetical protein
MKFLLRVAARLAERLGLNAVPAVAIARYDWPPMNAMMLYAAGNFVAIALAVLIVRLRAPVEGPSNGHIRQRRELIRTYLFLALTFGSCPLVFMLFFAWKTKSYPGGMFPMAFVLMLLFQLVGFAETLRLSRGHSMWDFELMLQRSLGRVFILFVATGLGVAVALFGGPAVFAIPFIALKLIADLWTMPAAIRGKSLPSPA